MLGGIEELALQPHGVTIGTVPAVRGGIPEGVVLGGVGHIPGITHLKGIGTFQIPEVAHRVGENDSVIVAFAQILGNRVLQDSCGAALRSGDGHLDQPGIGIIVALGVPEIILLPQFGGRIDIPAFHLFEGIGITALGNHDLFLKLRIGSTGVSGIEQIVGTVNLHHRTGTGPGILTAAAGGFQNGSINLGVGDKIGGGSQINGMVVGIAAILQIVDVVDTILVVGHGVAHIGLVDTIHSRQEVGAVFVGRLLTAGGSEGGEILVMIGAADCIPGICIPEGIQSQIGFNLVFFKIPGGGHGCVGIPALQHIAIPLYILRLGDLSALFQGQSSRIFAAVGVKGNGVGAAGGTAAQQQAEGQQYPNQALFHFGLLVSVALTEGMCKRTPSAVKTI